MDNTNNTASANGSNTPLTGEVIAPTNPGVTLDTPITRGTQIITRVSLRRPLTADLRGCSLGELAMMDVDAIAKVLPRISDPMLTNADVYKLSAPDIMKLGQEVLGFLLPKDASESLAA
jgi:hypothetical protein